MRFPVFAVQSLLGALFLLSLRCERLAAQAEPPCTGIMGAISEEISRLEEALKEPRTHSLMGVRFVTGILEGRSVVLASSGVGKVNAAMTATLMIERFKPKEILFSGIAGALNPELHPGDIIIAEKTVQHDLGTITPDGIQLRGMRNPVDWNRNPVFFEADSRLLAIADGSAKRIELEKVQNGSETLSPTIVKGIVATGDVFVAAAGKKEELRKSLKADAVEMEGAALAQICRQLSIPCLVIRSISDSADSNARQDASTFLEVAVRNSARLVTDIVSKLNSK